MHSVIALSACTHNLHSEEPMPLWALVLTLVFSALSVLGTAAGALIHIRLSARNSGRLEQEVDGVVEELGRQRTAIGDCQLAEHCEQQMKALGDRVNSTHKRIDGIEQRLNATDGVARRLEGLVSVLQAKA